MRVGVVRWFIVSIVWCLCLSFAPLQYGFAAERPLHEAARRGLLPSGDAGLVAGVMLYPATEVLPNSKKTGFAHEFYVYEVSYGNALLILPRFAGDTVKLYGLDYDEKNDFKEVRDKEPMYTRTLPGDTVFWLLLNIPDTSPRLRLCLESAGKERCFTPFISGKDGSLMLEDGFVELDPSL